MNKPILQTTALLILVTLIFACNSSYTFKKRGYFKIDFPKKEYRLFDEQGYPYSFEYPVYANIIKDSSFFGDTPENPWWINIDVPQLAGRVYVSYKEINAKNKFDSLLNDAFKLSYLKHTDIATGRDDSLIHTPNGAEGYFITLKGNTATTSQFFLTDSTRHFLRGVLYFEAVPNEDSLSLPNDFLKQDLFHLINTFKWKNQP
jgi:gliding motility-associated lipoprotein GldD